MGADAFSLTDRVALVTGGNGGLGRAIALGLRAAGASVAVSGRDEQKNAAVAAELGDPGAVFSLDVRDEAAVERTVSGVAGRYGRLDILVTCAGDFAGGSALELSLADWERVIGSHLTGTFLCARHAARAMAARGEGGKIVTIGSMYSLFGPSWYANYAAAKAGILGLTRALAVELAAHRIQVNAILPGWFETALTADASKTERGELIRRKTPAARWGEPDDLVGAAIFLSSPASDFITGVAIPGDGGYAIADQPLPELTTARQPTPSTARKQSPCPSACHPLRQEEYCFWVTPREPGSSVDRFRGARPARPVKAPTELRPAPRCATHYSSLPRSEHPQPRAPGLRNARGPEAPRL